MPFQLSVQTVGSAGQSVGVVPQVADLQNAQLVSEFHGRFYQQAYQSKIFFAGMTLTSISNVTFTTGTLGATETPVIGLVNPSGSAVNLEVLQATLGITITAATATGGGPFVWAVSTGNGAAGVFTTALKPWSRKTLTQAGSQALNLTGVALTGLTNNMVVASGSSLNGGSAEGYSFVSTAAGAQTVSGSGSVENFDGSLIIPPGGVLSLLATTTPVAHSAVSNIVWAEWPV